jgi:hypothetical protein
VRGDATEKKNARWGLFQSKIYHDAMTEILDSIILPAKYGWEVECADGINRKVYPYILGLIADNQEV